MGKEALGELVRQCLFCHHATGESVNPPAANMRCLNIATAEHMRPNRIQNLQPGVLPLRERSQLIVQYRDFRTQTTDVNRDILQFALTLKQMQHRQNFLGLSKRKNRDQDRTTFIKSLFDGRQESSLLVLPRIGRTKGSIPARCLDDENVYVAFWKISAPHQSLVQEVHITGVKNLFPFCPETNAGLSEDLTR